MKYSTTKTCIRLSKRKKWDVEGWNSLSKKLFLTFVIKLEILN